MVRAKLKKHLRFYLGTKPLYGGRKIGRDAEAPSNSEAMKLG